MNVTQKPQSKHILTIDILWGITIVGMIPVDNPGSWAHTSAPLECAEWNGMTPTDLVFPFFMFVMGVCIFISVQKYQLACNRQTVYKIIRRALLLYPVGVFVEWFSCFCYRWVSPLEDVTLGQQVWHTVWSFDTIRLSGVLAWLTICYGVTALLAITVHHRHLFSIVITLLIGYTILSFCGGDFAYDETNILSIVDRVVLTDTHMYHGSGIDPEGLLSIFPAIAHTFIGFLVGKLAFSRQETVTATTQSDLKAGFILRNIASLFIARTILTFSGLLLVYGCPLSKKIWSPTFVLTSYGLASTLLAPLIRLVDVKGYKHWCRFFEVFDMNPFFLYTTSDVIATLFGLLQFLFGDEPTSITSFFYRDVLSPLLGQNLGSLAHALLIITILWGLGYILYKKRIFIKL